MQIEFQVTFDDFLDALQHHHVRNARKRREQRRAMHVVIILDLVLLAVLGGLFWLLAGRFMLAGMSWRNLVGSTAASAITVLPWIELIAFLTVCGFAQRRPRRALFVLCLSLALVIVSAIAVFSLAGLREPYVVTAGTGPVYMRPGASLTLGNLFSWLVLVLLCALSTFTFGLLPRRLWKQQPNLSRPKKAEFRVDGFRVTDDVSNRDYQWPGVDSVVDTPSLVLIYYNKLSFEILPKRAFASDEMITQFWQLAAARGDSMPQGFPVRQVIPV
jgi:hypothetical protein